MESVSQRCHILEQVTRCSNLLLNKLKLLIPDPTPLIPLYDPGARFSNVPIINGPGKLSPFTLKIEVLIVLHLTR